MGVLKCPECLDYVFFKTFNDLPIFGATLVYLKREKEQIRVIFMFANTLHNN